MAKKQAPPKKSTPKNKAKSKSTIKRNLAIFALLLLILIIAYQYLHKQHLLNNLTTVPTKIIQQFSPSEEIQPTQPEQQQLKASTTRSLKKTVLSKPVSKEHLANFTGSITKAAKRMIDLPYKNGADPLKEQATDNSHLIFAIWHSSAQATGLSLGQYRPMQQLIADCQEIQLSELSNGDLIVLKDGNAGLIYGFSEENDGFYLIYASLSQQKVVSVPSQELRKYWLNQQNKKGYYRASSKIFLPL